MKYPILLLVCALALVGCGGGGDSGGGAPDDGSANALGSRDVPGGSIAVAKAGPVVPGATADFHITVTGLTPTQVRAWIGDDWDPSATGTVATAAGPSAYDVTVPVPASLPAGSHVWVRLVAADGSVIETGTDDFHL